MGEEKMTATIVILNRNAIALATDSAVTVGKRRVYTGTNKLFELSKVYPVGIMMCGNADHQGVGWETIIKSYRQHLGGDSFGEIADYAKHFAEFLQNIDIKSKKHEELFMYVLVKKEAEKLRLELGSVKKRVFYKKFESAVVDTINDYSAFPQILSPQELSRADFVTDHKAGIENIFNDVFSGYKISQANFNLVMELMYTRFCHGIFRDDYTTGLIFTGFGEAELLPAVVHYNIEGSICGNVRVAKVMEKKAGAHNDSGYDYATIFSFAQSDVATLFMEEVSPEMRAIIRASFEMSLKKFGKEILKEAGYDSSGASVVTNALLNKKIKAFSDKLWDDLGDFNHEKYVSPILQVLETLPKEEMASLADSLVELTSLKRKMSEELDSVSGPVDVAIITKGDGFVWKKRKYYFDKETNQDFVARQSKRLGG